MNGNSVASAATDRWNECDLVIFAQGVVVFLVFFVHGNHEARRVAGKRGMQSQQFARRILHGCGVGQAHLQIGCTRFLLVAGKQLYSDSQTTAS